jgi:hypothetical protein
VLQTTGEKAATSSPPFDIVTFTLIVGKGDRQKIETEMGHFYPAIFSEN